MVGGDLIASSCLGLPGFCCSYTKANVEVMDTDGHRLGGCKQMLPFDEWMGLICV